MLVSMGCFSYDTHGLFFYFTATGQSNFSIITLLNICTTLSTLILKKVLLRGICLVSLTFSLTSFPLKENYFVFTGTMFRTCTPLSLLSPGWPFHPRSQLSSYPSQVGTIDVHYSQKARLIALVCRVAETVLINFWLHASRKTVYRVL